MDPIIKDYSGLG
jgi:hypothetical protein